MKKFGMIFILICFNFLFALNLVPLNSNLPKLKRGHFLNQKQESFNNNSYNNQNLQGKINPYNISKTILYNGQPIIVYAGYQVPLDIRFPAYIEKIEYMAGKGGIYVYNRNLMNGTQILRILRKQNYKTENLIYVTLLGQKIPIIVKYPNNLHPTEHLVYINIPQNLLGLTKTNTNSTPKIVKVTTYKNLTFKTNIKSVMMIVRMIEGTANKYYQKINLSYHPKTHNGISKFFGAKNSTKEQYLALLFKKVFRGNKNFMTAFFNNEIIPQSLYINNFLVYLTNKRKTNLKIYGVKTKWCNLSSKYYKEINIDDIKLVFGKDILAAYHTFKKIPPRHCSEVYAVFYSLKNVNYKSLINY